jgi:hypothetical protein
MLSDSAILIFIADTLNLPDLRQPRLITDSCLHETGRKTLLKTDG